MSKIDDDLTEWASDIVRTMHKSGLSGINIIEKILRDPGIASGRSRSKILWWPRNRRIAAISRAAHQIDPIGLVCLVVHYGKPMNKDFGKDDDGNIFTKHDLAKNSSVTVREFNEHRKKARNKIAEITVSYRKRLERWRLFGLPFEGE